MKIYRFDPATGRRDKEPLRVARLATWTGPYDPGAAEHSARPANFSASADVHFYRDAGGTLPNGDDVSYKDAHYWICFCIGRDQNGTWGWVILAPIQPTPKEPT